VQDFAVPQLAAIQTVQALSFATPSFDGFANDFTIYCILFGE